MLHGVDVASYQLKLINRNKAWITAYPDFVMIKCTEGVGYHFSDCDMIAQMCKASDTPYGLYHYARAELNNAVDEAYQFCRFAEYHPNTILALDVEGKALGVASIDTWSRKWLDTVYKELGRRPLFYCSRSVCHKFPQVCAGNYGLWVAETGASKVGNIAPWKFWTMWQYSVDKSLPLDLNMFNGNEEQFKKYCEVTSG